MEYKSLLTLLKPKKYSDPARNIHSQKFEVDTWILSEFIIRKIIPIVSYSPYPLHELMLMVGAVCQIKPDYIFEWGTHLGKSARIFYETVSTFNLKTKIHTIDLPDEVGHIEHPGRQRGLLIQDLPIEMHQGDGITVAKNILKKLPKKSITLFFLDGDHSFSTVQRELEGVTSLRQHTHILVHDTFYQSQASRYNIGPYQAIEKFLRSNPNTYEKIHSGIGLPGMTLLYKTSNKYV